MYISYTLLVVIEGCFIINAALWLLVTLLWLRHNRLTTPVSLCGKSPIDLNFSSPKSSEINLKHQSQKLCWKHWHAPRYVCGRFWWRTWRTRRRLSNAFAVKESQSQHINL